MEAAFTTGPRAAGGVLAAERAQQRNPKDPNTGGKVGRNEVYTLDKEAWENARTAFEARIRELEAAAGERDQLRETVRHLESEKNRLASAHDSLSGHLGEARSALDPDADRGRPGVLGHVGQRLRADEVDGRLHRRREPLLLDV